jgi:exosome complex exonuclease RRP6
MLYYARSDTHYLLYIHDMLINELIEKSDMSKMDETNLLEWVLQRSKEVTLSRFAPTPYDAENGQGPGGWYSSLVKHPGAYSGEQFAVYKALHRWRDQRARELDESTAFTMNQKLLTDLAKAMPGDHVALRSLLGNIWLANDVMEQLLRIIEQAKAAGADGPSLSAFLRKDDGVAAAKAYFAKKASNQAQTQGSSQPQLLSDSMEPVPDVAELRSSQSQFWGDVPMSSVWEERSSTNGETSMQQVALPWTTFVQAAEAAEAAGPAQGAEAVTDGGASGNVPRMSTAADQTSLADTKFTLRAGRKRKAAEVDEAEDEEADGTTTAAADLTSDSDADKADSDGMQIILDAPGTNNGSDEEAKRKAAKKAKKKAQRLRKKANAGTPNAVVSTVAIDEERAARKAEKRARRAEIKAAKDADLSAMSSTAAAAGVPFDYAQAAKMLDKQNGAGNPLVRSAVFDPYAAKTQTSIPGVRAHNYEKKGRSATFKS